MAVSRRKRKSAQNSNEAEQSNPTGQSENLPANEITPRRTRSRSAGANNENSRKKRKTQASSPPEKEKEAKIKKSSDGKVRDIFCWMCHKIGGEVPCESCPRVYHADCLKKLKNKCGINVKCECDLKSVDGRNEEMKWDSLLLKRMLQYVMDRAIKPDVKSKSSLALKTKFSRFFHTWLAESEKLCKIMDMSILIDNMNGDEPYLNTGQFYLDVKWLYHNCYIFYGVDHEFTELAKKFENNIKLELTDLEACGECYRSKVSDNHADSFARVCSKPHEIIWAKLRGSPYWPAKCMDIQNGHAEVRFFGTHDRARIMTKNCFKISRHHPYNRKIHKPQYQDAMREVSIYISNYKAIHGDFNFYESNTPLEDKNPKKSSKGQSNTLTRRPATMVPECEQTDDEDDDDDDANTNKTAENGQILPTITKQKAPDNTTSKHTDNTTGIQETTNVNSKTSEPTDKKTSLSLCCVNDLNQNERNQNISESISENGVTFQMSFTTEHEHSEPISEQTNTYEFLSSSSENFELPQTSLNPAITLPTLDKTSIQSTANLIVAGTDMDENSINCPNIVNSSVLNKESLPVITSTHSSVEIPDVSQLAEPNSVNSLPIIASTSSAADKNIDFVSRGISALNDKGEMQINEPQTPNPSLLMSSFREQMQNFVTENNINLLFDAEEEPEEEIQVISEESKTHSIMKNPAIVKAVAEILLATKPNIKNQFRQLQEKFLYSYISMYMDAYYARFDNQEIKLFVDVCNRCLKKNQNLEKDNSQLRKDIKKLQEDVIRLEGEKESRNKMDSQKNMLKDVIIQKASERMRRSDCNELQLQKYKENEMHLTQEIESLKSKLNETKEKLEIKDQELGFYRQTKEELKAQLNKLNERNKNVKSIEIQTDPIILKSKENHSCEFVSSEDQMEYSPNTSDDESGSEEHETYTQTFKQTKIVIRRETVSSILADNELNVNDLPQTYEENEFMANFQPTLMPSITSSYIASSAPPLLPIMAPNQGRIFLDSENSSSFLEAAMQETNSNNLEGPMKTYIKRKKKDI